MRIISGIFRGKRIRPPGNFKARPTTDFAKENLFNILIHQYNIEEMDVLDLFSGTGSISYEFASRGARSVVAVEMATAHFRFIQETCRSMQLEQVTVIRADVFKYLKRPTHSFDIIFADPPYDHPGLAELPDLILTTDILNKEGLFILEHSDSYSFTAHPHFLQHRKYGGVHFTIFS
ncbi:MAG: RsmD family RNA methyltransferase [Bacteroidales bacterium]|nr:RsmD family RNA methyltransferase [Bacteroidales bacterium]